MHLSTKEATYVCICAGLRPVLNANATLSHASIAAVAIFTLFIHIAIPIKIRNYKKKIQPFAGEVKTLQGKQLQFKLLFSF